MVTKPRLTLSKQPGGLGMGRRTLAGIRRISYFRKGFHWMDFHLHLVM